MLGLTGTEMDLVMCWAIKGGMLVGGGGGGSS